MAIVKHRDMTIKTVGMNPATFTFISNKDEFEAIMEMPCMGYKKSNLNSNATY